MLCSPGGSSVRSTTVGGEGQRPAKPTPQHESTVAKWSERVSRMLDEGAAPTAIFDCLRLQGDDFRGSLSAIKRLCKQLRVGKGIDPSDVAIPVDTEPGR